MIFIVTLSALGVVSFLIGVAFVLKATVNAPDMDKVVSKKDYEQVQQDLQRILDDEQTLKLQLDSMALELNDSRQKVASGEEVGRQVDALRLRDQEYQAMIQQLKQQLEFLSQKADDQARKAIDVIQTLDSQRQTLKEELDHLDQSLPPEHIEAMQKEKTLLQEQVQANQGRIAELEKELSDAQRASKEELTQRENEAEQLRAENAAFQEGIQRMTEKISRVKAEVDEIRVQKERELVEAREMILRLQQEKQASSSADLSHAAQDVVRLEQEVQRVRAESQQRLEDAHAHMETLKDQIRNLKQEIIVNHGRREELEQALRKSHDGLSVSDFDGADQQEMAHLQQKNKQLEEQSNELKLLNQFLKDKEALLSEELLKNQTHAMGLQKICEEFQKELGSHT